MERDYNKNRRSFRSERSENRRGYGAEQGERYTAGSVGNRNTTRRFERTSERNNGERRERNFNREKDTYRERPVKFSNRRDYRPSTEATDRQDRTERSERKVLVKRIIHADHVFSGQEVRRPPGTIIRIIIVLSTAIGKRFPGERKKD